MPPISRRAPSDRWVMCWQHLKIRKENCNLQKSPRESGCPRHHLTVISVSGCLKNPPTSWDVSSKHGEAERKRKQKRRELRVNLALSIVYWLSTFCGCQESLIENRFTNASCALFARLPAGRRDDNGDVCQGSAPTNDWPPRVKAPTLEDQTTVIYKDLGKLENLRSYNSYAMFSTEIQRILVLLAEKNDTRKSNS